MTRLCAVLLAVVVLGVGVNAGSATASASKVPAGVQHRIAALFGAHGYMPGWLPAGFIYIGWKPQPPSGPNGSVIYGRFTITFAHAGKVLLWRMDDPVDAYDCTSNYANARAIVNGRRVSFINGNHGQSGIWCFGGQPQHRYEISTWDDHVFSPAIEMKIVANATLAR
jgi:hypothetical protein